MATLKRGELGAEKKKLGAGITLKRGELGAGNISHAGAIAAAQKKNTLYERSGASEPTSLTPTP